MPPQRAQLTMVGLHISVELAGIIGDLDVYSRQAVIVVSRFTALVHESLRFPHNLSSQYEPAGPRA